MSLAEKQAQLIEDLSIVDDPQERLSLVVDRSRKRPPLPAADRIDANRVKGCISQVWLIAELDQGRPTFRCDADSPLVRGLVVMFCDFYTGEDLADIATFEPDFIAQLGLTRNLTPTRLNGLNAVIATIRAFARAHAGPAA